MILINSSLKDALKMFQPFLPIYVPIGLGYLVAAAECEGIKARVIDEQIENNVIDKIVENVSELEPPYFFGFSVLTAAFKSAILLSKQLKELYPDSIICFGGVHPTADPEGVLSYKHVDIVLRGEGEKTLPELYRCVKEGNSFAGIENLSYRQNGQIIHNRRSSVIQNLDSLPAFPYHLFTSKKYDLGFVVSSRGCPYKCIFCSNRITTGRKYRFRSPEAILDELNMLYKKYAIRHILFHDDNFLVSKKRIYQLIELVKRHGLDRKMTFSFQARGDNVDYKLLVDLYNAGFTSVFFGLETASNRIMRLIQKGETVEQCVEAVRMAKEIGFHVSATFIYALPGETHEDRMDCVKLSKELNLDMVRFNNAIPYPGTVLHEIAKSENRLNVQGLYENFISVSTFIENPFKKIPFAYIPAGNTENIIRNDILFSYLVFYLDIDKIKRIFTRPDEGVGWFSAGAKIAEVIKKIPALILLGVLLTIKFGYLFTNILLKRNTSISFGKLLKSF